MTSFYRVALALVLILAISISTLKVSAQASSSQYPNDPLFQQQWYLHNTGQDGGTPGADIHALEAWSIGKCSPDEIAGILDTGVDSDHPDLADKLLPGAIYVPGVTSTEDVLNHGTGVAGVVAADTDNGVGIAGICPLGRILNVKVANDQGHTDDPEVGQGIQWAVDHGARVVNLSLWTDDVPPMAAGVAYAYAHNVVVVASADGSEPYPSTYPHVLAVGGSDNKDHALATVPVKAPDLVVAPDTRVDTTTSTGKYGDFCTCISIAAPMVTGVVALIQSLRPDMTVDQVIDAVDKGADPIEGQTGFNGIDGWGRVNAYRSLQIAQALPPFTLRAGVATKSLTSGQRNRLTVRTLSRARLALKFSYPGGRHAKESATVGASGTYAFTWRPPARTGTVAVSITATHGFVVKTSRLRFTIR